MMSCFSKEDLGNLLHFWIRDKRVIVMGCFSSVVLGASFGNCCVSR